MNNSVYGRRGVDASSAGRTEALQQLDTAVVAAAGAAAILVTRRVKPEKIYRQVDWDLLMLFVGLFVVVGGFSHAGLDERLFAELRPLGLGTITRWCRGCPTPPPPA